MLLPAEKKMVEKPVVPFLNKLWMYITILFDLVSRNSNHPKTTVDHGFECLKKLYMLGYVGPLNVRAGTSGTMRLSRCTRSPVVWQT